MNERLAKVLDAHGGVHRWNGYERVEATLVSGGGLFALKGVPQDPNPRRMTVWLREERSSVMPYGAPDQRTMFTPDRIAIEKLDGTLVAERRAPRDSFAGHQMSTALDPLHRAYFNGEALWTHLTTPFLLAMNGVRVEETETWREGAETWRVLRTYFPGSIETHCLVQDFFFGEDLMLRRHDYSVNVHLAEVRFDGLSDLIGNARDLVVVRPGRDVLRRSAPVSMTATLGSTNRCR